MSLQPEPIWVTARWDGGKNWRSEIHMRGVTIVVHGAFKGEQTAYMAGVRAMERMMAATPTGAHTENVRERVVAALAKVGP